MNDPDPDLAARANFIADSMDRFDDMGIARLAAREGAADRPVPAEPVGPVEPPPFDHLLALIGDPEMPPVGPPAGYPPWNVHEIPPGHPSFQDDDEPLSPLPTMEPPTIDPEWEANQPMPGHPLAPARSSLAASGRRTRIAGGRRKTANLCLVLNVAARRGRGACSTAPLSTRRIRSGSARARAASRGRPCRPERRCRLA